MSPIARALLALLVFVSACVAACLGWLYLYTRDLPDPSQLERLAPISRVEVPMRFCDGIAASIQAVPPQEFGRYSVPALKAADGAPDLRSPYHAFVDDFGRTEFQRRSMYSAQIARRLVCGREQALRHALTELRLANQIHQRFTPEQILTIYLNMAYFGEGVLGIESASSHYFGKHASDLSLAEAATLVGMIQAPRRYSPIERPQQALERRNIIIDKMVQDALITSDEAANAKATVLRVSSAVSR